MEEKLSATVLAAESLEPLTRPLLEMLEVVTGLESTHMTSVDQDNAAQSISIARNTGELSIPEGLTIPWSDTLCKRCLEQARRVVSNVSEVWRDSQAAVALGIETYASAPVCGSNGEVIGTLCAAVKTTRKFGPRARSALNLFSKLIAEHIERERLLEQLRRSNDYLTKCALTDSLTELPNRRELRDELGRIFPGASAGVVAVRFLSVDQALGLADDAMYRAKRELRQAR